MTTRHNFNEAKADLPAKWNVVPVQEPLELLATPLPINLAEEALRHAGCLDYGKALKDRGLVRHELPQEMLALRDVLTPHAAPGLGHVAKHGASFFYLGGSALNTA
jgi:hypothetical protein